MTPFESQALQGLGIAYLESIESLSIFIFFYGASRVAARHVWLIHEFDNRIVRCAFFCVGHCLRVRFVLPAGHLFLARPDPPIFRRRRGFSNHAIAAVFVATVINFLLFSIRAGSDIAKFVVFIRTALILDINYPLLEDQELVNNAIGSVDTVITWTQTLPVSSNLLRSDSSV